MNIEARLKVLEENLNMSGNRIPYEDLVRWFTMFAEKQGTGHVSPQVDFTTEDWNWYNEFVEMHGGEENLFNHK